MICLYVTATLVSGGLAAFFIAAYMDEKVKVKAYKIKVKSMQEIIDKTQEHANK